LFQDAAMSGLNQKALGIQASPEVFAQLRLAGQLFQERLVGTDEFQLVVMLEQLDPAIAFDAFGNLGQQIDRQRELAVFLQDNDHVIRSQAGRRRVPKGQVA